MLRSPGLRALGLALAVLGGACQAPPSPPPRAAAPRPDPLAQARAAMDRSDYAGAAALLRQVVASSPDSLEAHYRLGVSASFLNLFDEATGEFTWVVAHAPADSAEARSAREWLGASARASASPALPAEPNPDRASLTGVALDGPRGLVRRKISLKGMKAPVLETAYDVRTDQEGRFAFPDVPPGEYMLTDSLSGETKWRLRLTLKAGERATVNLTADNTVQVRDDFPDSR